MSTPDSSCLYYIIHNREQRSCAGVQQQQELLLREALGSGHRESREVERSSSSLAIFPEFPSHSSEDSYRALSTFLQESTDTPHLLADDPGLVRVRDFPTAGLHCWASVRTDPDPKLSLKPIAIFFQ